MAARKRKEAGGDPAVTAVLAASLAELARLAAEATERSDRGRFVEAMGSLAAIEPVRQLILEQLGIRWSSALDLRGSTDDTPGVYL